MNRWSNLISLYSTLTIYMCNELKSQGLIQDSRKEGARPNIAGKKQKLIIFMTCLINVRSNVKAVVVEKKGLLLVL